MGIDWKRKLSSRKFWAAIAGYVGLWYVILTTGVTEEKIVALIMQTGLLCSYILTEGWTDSSNAGYVYNTPAEEDPDEDGEDDGVAF